MIRGKFVALAGAIVGAMLVAGAAQAASPLTLKCVRKEASELRACVSACRSQFKLERAQCYGPGLQCALACTSANDKCLADNVTGPLDACNQTCALGQRNTIDVCRSQFQNGLITETELESCANTARLMNLECRLGCTDQFDELRFNCNQAQAACLASCASCGTPEQCPAN